MDRRSGRAAAPRETVVCSIRSWVVSATRDEKAGLDACPARAYLSANRTCEMGLRHATGQPYESFIFLLGRTSQIILS
jgi:hypothetical protein